MLTKISKELFSDLARGLRLFVIAIPVSLVTVLALAWANRAATGDEIAVTAAVPLLIFYVMIRGIMWVASGMPDLTEEEMRNLQPPTFITVAFVLGMWWVMAGGLSAIAYWALGLDRALLVIVSSLKWTLMIVATAAVLISLMALCKSWLLKSAKLFHEIFDDPFSFFHGRA